MKTKKVVIVGAGLSSLLLALDLSNHGCDVTVIEKDSSVGGMFKSIHYSDSIVFDIGMHIYYETSDPYIDNLFYQLLEPDEWIIRGDNYKDIAGIFYNGILQKETPYLDLRSSSDEDKKAFLADLFMQIARPQVDHQNQLKTAKDYFQSKFGNAITEKVFAKVLNKLYGYALDELDIFATQLLKMDRVVIYDCEQMFDLMKSSLIRSRIAYPDQMSLPPYRTNDQKYLYPKKFGFYNAINALEKKLLDNGVQILCSSSVKAISIKDQQIQLIATEEREISGINHVYWSAGAHTLAPHLNVPVSKMQFKKMVTVNLIFNKEPNMGMLYYFYCMDEGFNTFRVTNYSNYCPGARSELGYPLCVELWADNLPEQTNFINVAIRELKAFTVIDDSYNVTFSAIEAHKGGFPVPTVANVSNINSLRDEINSKGIKNLDIIGILAKPGIFFLKDSLLDAFSRSKILTNQALL